MMTMFISALGFYASVLIISQLVHLTSGRD